MHWWSGVEAALLSSADCRIVDLFLFCTLTELLVLTKFWTFLNMAHLHFVFTFLESLCYVLLFSLANKNFLLTAVKWLSNRASCFGPPNRKKPYNKHLISGVFGQYSKLRILVFFHRFMAVCNLQYGPKTWLIRGIQPNASGKVCEWWIAGVICGPGHVSILNRWWKLDKIHPWNRSDG